MGVALGLLAAVLVRKLRLRRRPRHMPAAAGYRQHDRRDDSHRRGLGRAADLRRAPRHADRLAGRAGSVQTVLKELPDDRAVNLVCKDASGQTWSTFADSGWGPDNLAEATADAGQTSARGSRHESSRSTPPNECRFREQPRTTPAAPERSGRMPCSLPICGASSAAVTGMAPRADCPVRVLRLGSEWRGEVARWSYGRPGVAHVRGSSRKPISHGG